MSKRTIIIADYDPTWPSQYAKIEKSLRNIFQQHLGCIHHAGSTAIPKLPAKPIIDIWIGVNNILQVDRLNDAMGELGFSAKGEFGMPFRRFFTRTTPKPECNIHVFEQDNPELDRHLRFRDYLRAHPEQRDAYGALKQQLATQYPHDIYHYVIGKEQFVRDIDRISGYHGVRMVQALTPIEIEAYQRLTGIQLSEQPKSDHFHLVFFADVDIIGALHIECCPHQTAVIHQCVIDADHKNQGYDAQLLALAERWIEHQNLTLRA